MVSSRSLTDDEAGFLVYVRVHVGSTVPAIRCARGSGRQAEPRIALPQQPVDHGLAPDGAGDFVGRITSEFQAVMKVTPR